MNYPPSTPVKGCYLLLLRLSRRTEITFSRQSHLFKAGYYVYCGSAQNGLTQRIDRHLRHSRKIHWHIDRLLAVSRIIDIQLKFSQQKKDECLLAGEVATWPAAAAVPGFGAGDCGCNTHLFYFSRRPPCSILAKPFLKNLSSIYRFLQNNYQNHAMWERDPFQTLASCILSLRTQDPTTEKASNRLFKVCPDPVTLKATPQSKIAELIYPVGMYNEKAKTLHRIAEQLIARFNKRTPQEINELLTLPGVGRKTANLVRSFAFHQPAVCVDTHVHRITNRWGLVRTAAPEQTELELRRILPEKYWIETNRFLVRHGQQVCRPFRPQCRNCGLEEYCMYPKLVQENDLKKNLTNPPHHPCLNFR